MYALSFLISFMIFSTEFFTSLKVLCLAKIIDSLKMNTDGMCRVMYFFWVHFILLSYVYLFMVLYHVIPLSGMTRKTLFCLMFLF